MKFSDIQNLTNAYTKIISEDVGLGGHVAGTGQGTPVMGVNFPDTAANKQIQHDPQKTEIDIKSAIEELKSIFGELKNAEGLESWVASKLATAADRVELLHNNIIR